MDRLDLDLVLHTPVHVGTGVSRLGVHETVDRRVPVPASSVKGVMRAAAVDLLSPGREPFRASPDTAPEPDDEHGRAGDVADDQPPLVRSVFGGRGTASPWHWSDPELVTSRPDDDVEHRTRIRIDPDTGTVLDGALVVTEVVRPGTMRLSVTRRRPVAPTDLPAHRALLVLSALLIDGVGGGRSAGLGWASLTPVSGTPVPDPARLLQEVHTWIPR
jgi:CRISPR/Cas system CMR subunit Cmr4 (Cas7 group RAMP superfamily)